MYERYIVVANLEPSVMSDSKLSTLVCLMGLSLLIGMQQTSAQTLPPAVYLHEGFNTTGIPTGWTVTTVIGGTANWSVVGLGTNPPIPPYAGSGQAKFNSYDATPGHQSRLTTRRIDFSTSSDPFLVFFLYHDDEFISSLDSIYVEGTTGDSVTGPWTALGGYRRPSVFNGWRQELISLLPFGGAARVFLGFRGLSQYGNNIYLDELRIADSSFHDMGMLTLLSPGSSFGASSVAMNTARQRNHEDKPTQNTSDNHGEMSVVPFATPLNVSTIVQNYGTFPEPTYQIRWQIDGQPQPAVNNTRALSRGGRDTLLLSWLTPTPGTHLMTAWTSLTSDSNRSNDSLRLTVAVLDSSVIFAEMFNGGIFPPSGWTVVNRDGGLLPPWFQGSSASVFVPYEGTGFAADNFQRANGTYIDDYLISPLIPGIGQVGRVDSLGCWVRSPFNAPPAQNFPDSLMVLLSTTGADTSNFTILLDYFSVPKTGWAQRTYQLSGRVPNGSNLRIAFRYLHYNGGSSGANSDFVGLDFVHVSRKLPTSIDGSDALPASFTLCQSYPNPFNPSTEIVFSVDVSGETTLDLYNVLGERVEALFAGNADAGHFYRVRVDGSRLSSGVYFYRLESLGKVNTRKFVLLR